MAEIKHSIDWLQYSCDWPNEVRDWPLQPEEQIIVARTAIPHLAVNGLPPQRSTKITGMEGYNKSYNMLYCTVHVAPNNRGQKMGVRFDGSHMGVWRDLGGTDARLVAFVKDIRGSASRIDIAFDLLGYGVNPLRVYEDWKKGKWTSRARTVQPLTKGVMGADGVVTEASTIYIGSRSSQIMVRMYEKGKQMGLPDDWLRVEIELKGDKAQCAIEDMVRLGIPEVGRQILREFIDMKYKFWRDLTQGKSVELSSVGRKRTDREAWVHNVIIPMLSEMIDEEWGGEGSCMTLQAVEAVMRAGWHKRAMYLREQHGILTR